MPEQGQAVAARSVPPPTATKPPMPPPGASGVTPPASPRACSVCGSTKNVQYPTETKTELVLVCGKHQGWSAKDLKQRPGDQPLPIRNDAPDVQSQVIADIETRRELGIQRYGTALQPHNGRDALRDLYEELLDAACYAKQMLVERDGA